MSLGPYVNTGATMSDRDLFGLIIGGKPSDSTDGYTLAHHEERDTALSIAVSQNGDVHNLIFIPRKCITSMRALGKTAQCQVGAKQYPVIEVQIPEWLAKQKGLI